ncbi:hypothetical protein FGO68_gene2232 [Halteria grandinella]|uniref:TRP C-terminal domain-containing protein n=1 Tax=Halteria grandinella TaxID=5974 RepID=A0A8J8P7L8_HALGN|nr:hypothetical protein FGO68_gene2232 [Halteria grandinella]
MSFLREAPYVMRVEIAYSQVVHKTFKIYLFIVQGLTGTDPKNQNETNQTSEQPLYKQPILLQNRTAYDLKAWVKSISPFGELAIRFSSDVFIPDKEIFQQEGILSLKLVPNEFYWDSQQKLLIGWKIVTFSTREVTIQLEFADPNEISPRVIYEDKILVEFKANALFQRQTDFKYIKVNYSIQGDIPQQIQQSYAIMTLQKSAESTVSSLAYLTVGNWILQLLISFSMHKMWGMMNTLKLMRFMLKFNLLVPGNAELFFQVIDEYLDMRSGYIQVGVIYVQEKLVGDGQGRGESLMEKLGTFLFVIVAFSIAALALVIVGLASRKIKVVQRGIDKVKGMLFFNSILRASKQTYYKVSVVTLSYLSLQTTSFTENILPSILSVILFLYLCAFQIFAVVFLLKNYTQMGEKSFQQRFGALFNNLSPFTKDSIHLTTIFLARRFFLALLIVIVNQSPTLQLFGMSLSSSLSIAYVLRVRPLSDPQLNRQEIFNECCLLSTSLIAYVFTDYTEDSGVRWSLGWLFVSIAFLNIGVTIGTTIFQLLVLICKKLVAKCGRIQLHPTQPQVQQDVQMTINKSQSQPLNFEVSMDHQDQTPATSISAEKSVEIEHIAPKVEQVPLMDQIRAVIKDKIRQKVIIKRKVIRMVKKKKQREPSFGLDEFKPV